MTTSTDAVAVAWVHPEEVAHSFLQSMLGLQGRLMASGGRGRLLPMAFSSAGIAYSRNRVVARFLEHDDDWLFWVDTDIGFDPDTIERLRDVADPDTRPVVSGLYFANHQFAPDGVGGFQTSLVPTVYRWAQLPSGQTGFVAWHDYPRDRLVQVDAAGSGCVLIHRSVFEKIAAKYGPMWYTNLANPDSDEPFGEDMSFCVRLAEFGIPMFCHTGVKTTHLKALWASEAHYDAQRSATAPPAQPNREQRRAAAKSKG